MLWGKNNTILNVWIVRTWCIIIWLCFIIFSPSNFVTEFFRSEVAFSNVLITTSILLLWHFRAFSLLVWDFGVFQFLFCFAFMFLLFCYCSNIDKRSVLLNLLIPTTSNLCARIMQYVLIPKFHDIVISVWVIDCFGLLHPCSFWCYHSIVFVHISV